MQRRELSEEEKRLIEQYSEGNKYLEQLLTECWETGIETFACCGGHNDKESTPYIGITINDNIMYHLKKILGNLQDMDGTIIRTDIRRKLNLSTEQEEIWPDQECRALAIYGENYNRCELFARILEGIKSDKEPELNYKFSEFYKDVQNLRNTDYQTIKEWIDQQLIVGSTVVGNNTNLVEYKISNRWREKLKRVPIIRRILESFSPRIREENQRYDELKATYEQFQEEYNPEENEKSQESDFRRTIQFDVTVTKGDNAESERVLKQPNGEPNQGQRRKW